MRPLTAFILILLAFVSAIAPTSAQDAPKPPAPIMPYDPVAAFHRLVEYGMAENAEEMLLEHLRSHPDDVGATLVLSRHYLRGERVNPKQAWELAVAATSVAAGHSSFATDYDLNYALAQAAYLYAGQFRAPDAESRARYQALTNQTSDNALEALRKLEELPAEADLSEEEAQRRRTVSSGAAFLLGEVERTAAFYAKRDGRETTRRASLTKAYDHYRRALSFDKDHAAAALALASVLNEANRGEEAQKLVENWETRFRPTVESCDLGARSAYQRSGTPDYLTLARYLTRAVLISPSIENQVNASLAQRIAAMDDPATQLEVLRTHLSLNESSVRPLDRSKLLARWLPPAEGQDQPASNGPVIPEFCYLVAEAHFGVLNTMSGLNEKQTAMHGEEALRLLAQCTDIEELIPDVVRVKAMTLVYLSRFAEARDAFERLVSLDPSDSEAALRIDLMDDLAQGRTSLGVYEDLQAVLNVPLKSGERMDALNDLLPQAPRFPLLRLVLGHQEYALSHFAVAESHFEVASIERPQSLSAWLGLGRSRMRQEKWDSALEAFNKALALKPEDEEATAWSDILRRIVERRGIVGDSIPFFLNAQFQGNTPEQKLKLLKQALELSPGYHEAAVQAANLAQELGQTEDANAFAATALAASSSPLQLSVAKAILANLALSQRRYADAVQAYQEALDATAPKDPRRSGLTWLAARAAFLNGDVLAAHSLLNREVASGTGLHALQPDHESSLFLPQDRHPKDGTRRVLAPRLTVGAAFGATLTFGVEVEGGHATKPNEASSTVSAQVSIHVEATPAISGVFKLRVTFSEISETGLAVADGQQMLVELSPWFGLLSTPWIDEEVDATINGAREVLSLPLTTLLVEAFCLVPTPEPMELGTVWGRRMVDGKLHFQEDREVCWVQALDEDELTLGRLSVMDWRERFEGGRTYNPRRFIESRVMLRAADGFPLEVTLKSVRKQAALEGRDVRISRNHMQLNFR